MSTGTKVSTKQQKLVRKPSGRVRKVTFRNSKKVKHYGKQTEFERNLSSITDPKAKERIMKQKIKSDAAVSRSNAKTGAITSVAGGAEGTAYGVASKLTNNAKEVNYSNPSDIGQNVEGGITTSKEHRDEDEEGYDYPGIMS